MAGRARSSKPLFRNTAVAAARAGGKVLLRYFTKKFRVHYKGEVNLVTEAVTVISRYRICSAMKSPAEEQR